MGSQAVYNATVAAPVAIVVRTGTRYSVALLTGAEQPDGLGGGRGPVVLTYERRPEVRSYDVAAATAARIIETHKNRT